MLFIEPPKEAIVRAMNAASNLNPSIEADKVTFGNPEVWIQGDTNTRIQVTVASDFYIGSDTFYYNRVRIYDYFAGHVMPGAATDYANVKEVMTAFYTRYQLPFDPDDLVNSVVDPGDTTVTLQGRNSSLMFVSNLQVVLPFEG